MKVIDFSAALPSAASIKAAGYGGVMLYCAPGREAWMKGKQPPRSYLDDLDSHGIKFGFVFQYGGADNPDTMRGYDGGVADAQAAKEYLESVNCSGHPIYFAVDFNVNLTQWNTIVYRYFTGAISVLGQNRVGIYGHSRAVAWAQQDGVVAEVEPGRVLGWVAGPRSWGSWDGDRKRGRDYAVMFQHPTNIPGPDGVQIDENEVWSEHWGWTGVGLSGEPGPADLSGYEDLPRVDTLVPMDKHYTKGRTRKIKYLTRHHLAGIGDAQWAWDIWQNRAASAHYVVGPDAQVGQLVRRKDTAWGNADAGSNNETIVIEHSNSTGAPGWDISDPVIRRGAELAAELCIVEDLGRPLFGLNIRDHREFTNTSCPHHLARGEKYHDPWMHHAQQHYDRLVAGEAALTLTFLEELMSQSVQSYINPDKSFPAPTALSLIDASSWRTEVLSEALLHALGIDVAHVLGEALEADNTGQNRTAAIRRALNLKELQ